MKSRFIVGLVSKLLLIFFCQNVYSQNEGIDMIDSLNAELPKLANDTNKVKTLAELCFHLRTYNLEEGVKAGKRALKLAQDLHYDYGIAISRQYLSINYFYQSIKHLAIENLLEAEPIFQKTGDVDRLCATYIELSAIYVLYDTLKMKEYYYKAKSIYSEVKTDRWKTFNMSWIQNMSGRVEPDSSEKYNLLLMKLLEQHNTPQNLSMKYVLLAIFYENKNNLDSGFYYRNLMLPIIKQLKDNRALSFWYYTLASRYWRGDETKTKSYITRQKAYEYLNLSIIISKEYGLYIPIYQSYMALYTMQKDQGQYEQALFSLEQFLTYSNEYIFSGNASKIAALTWKNEKKIKEMEVELLKKENALRLKIIIIGTIGIFLILLLIVLVIIIWKKNLKLRRRQTDLQLITLEQKALQSMMNPHFIFNALSSIQHYLLQNKPGEAGLYLSQFARLIRQNLSAINSSMIILDEEIDRLKNYLDLEKLRMEDKFEYTIELGEDVEEDEVRIPSMIIQPFVENAIWHGISAIQGKGMIRISFVMHSPDSIKISIADNGIGMKQTGGYASKSENHLHMGMSMTRKRIEIIGKRMNVQTSFDAAETSPGEANPGTCVVIVVPVSYGKSDL